MSRVHRIKRATTKFNKSTAPQLSVSVDIPSLILTNPAIYTALANYIIHYRMATWRCERNSPEIVHHYFKNIYLPVMLAEAQRLKLSQCNMTELKRLTVTLMNTITSDVEDNTTWATNYLVHLCQDSNIFNYITHENTLSKMRELQHHIFRSEQRKKDQELRHSSRRIKFSEILKQEWHASQQEIKSFSESEKNFFEYMPLSCRIKYNFHSFVQIVMIFVFTLSFLYLIGRINSSSDFSLGNMSIALTITAAYFFLEKLSGQFFGTGIFLKTPFRFMNMKETLKAGLLSEIAETLVIIKTPDNPPAEVKTTVSPQFTRENPDPIATTPQSSKKKQIKKVKPGWLVEEEKNRSMILANAKLAPAIILIWQTHQWGTIAAQVGKTTKNIYPLWSGNPRINASCQFYLVFFPIEQLKQEHDDGMIDECKNVLEIGRVVPPRGRPGVVWESHDSLKIKMFSSGQGSRTTGKPAEWRQSLFYLRHPQDLTDPAPTIGGHQYQLFVPEQLRKTH